MRSKRLGERIFADWPAKILSLGAALLLFFFYQLNRLEERYMSVPLEVGTGDDFVPANQYPRSVSITLRGESKSLSTIKEADISASVDLTAFRSEGSYRVPIRIERRGGAVGVDPLEIHVDPTDIAVTLERRSFRFVPVSPSFKGAVQSGYELESFEIDPPEIEISGPASLVARIVDIKTEAVDLSSRSADFAVKVKLVNKDSFLTISGAGVVDVRCVVRRAPDQVSFDGVPISLENIPSFLVPAELLPRARVELRALNPSEGTMIKELPQGTLSVDLSAVRRPGAYDLPVHARAPEGYEIVGLDPPEVRVVLAAGTAEAGTP